MDGSTDNQRYWCKRLGRGLEQLRHPYITLWHHYKTHTTPMNQFWPFLHLQQVIWAKSDPDCWWPGLWDASTDNQRYWCERLVSDLVQLRHPSIWHQYKTHTIHLNQFWPSLHLSRLYGIWAKSDPWPWLQWSFFFRGTAEYWTWSKRLSAAPMYDFDREIANISI